MLGHKVNSHVYDEEDLIQNGSLLKSLKVMVLHLTEESSVDEEFEGRNEREGDVGYLPHLVERVGG